MTASWVGVARHASLIPRPVAPKAPKARVAGSGEKGEGYPMGLSAGCPLSRQGAYVSLIVSGLYLNCGGAGMQRMHGRYALAAYLNG